jgi:hypothetical protein
MMVVIKRQFPDFYKELSVLPDYRSRPHYEVRELVMSGLLMFLFRSTSRNEADNRSKNLDFQDNVQRAFGVKVADMDTVDRYLRQLPTEKLESIKYGIIRALIKNKVLHKHRYNNLHYNVAIDGSGMQSYEYEPYPGCPYKEFKSGKKVWTVYVLEAKLLTDNGFALSLMTEWIENPKGGAFVKQDSELKAFKRLTARLKKEFPRLPVMLLLDGLYPNNTVFNIAREYSYKLIVTLKDKSLKTVQEQISDMERFSQHEQCTHATIEGRYHKTYKYKIFKNIEYRGNTLFVFETEEEKKHVKKQDVDKTRFVHITTETVNACNVHSVSSTGRLRWKIENEGFNIQKTHYSMTHKFSRKSFNATKNYYTLLQIAEIINQLTFMQKHIREFIKQRGMVLSAILKEIAAYFSALEQAEGDDELILQIIDKKVQFRY